MPLMISFRERDKKNRSRLPNDDDAVFDAVTRRKNANSRTGPGYGLGLATLTKRLREKGTRDANNILLLDSTGRKKNT